MNREERRRIMHKLPRYRTAIKQASRKAMEDLEKMLQNKWNQEDKEKEKRGDE